MDFDTARVVADVNVRAVDLNPDYLGKTFGAYDDRAHVDYLVTVWYSMIEKDGSVTMWLWHDAVPGRAVYTDTLTVAPDYVVEFVKLDEGTRTPVRN
ncbi:hypothetical protein CH267_02230 [Rhodococcus sp. 06-621-2]|nr:hypothetical protein [Rhodococcus sp. 06-621-2]OZC62377.1 hypothetical protein CH267_02230 [Rhodococcus sp. 06-621-2]